MKRVYENDRIRVFWDSDKCIHVAYCTRDLPAVFDIHRRPWVDINAATPEEIARVVDTCPTGALSYEFIGEPEPEEATIKVLRDGPFKVSGKCRLLKENGEAIETGKVFALCRCGASKRMPFCDGAHIGIDFKDDEDEKTGGEG